MKRTHLCGELRETDISKKVTLCGWMHKRRDHGGVIFVDIRDYTGITQVVFNPEHNKALYDLAYTLKREDVLEVSGEVRKRIEGQLKDDLPTGHIEVFADTLEIITRSKPIPLETEHVSSGDDTRLKWRYIDLRRPEMQANLRLRNTAMLAARAYFDTHGFVEVETPLLVRSTPEGARDYVVPSRLSHGSFYALPQSPQIYKQILMIAGMDRYYQFARCLRDEDLRQDRQPEHTQMDVEMSFVEASDVMAFVEGLFKHIVKEVKDVALNDAFPILTYAESMRRFGTDKPDLRFSLELRDVSALVEKSGFKVFSDTVAKDGIVKAIIPEKDLSRKEIDALETYAKELGAKGLAWMKCTSAGLDGGVAKFFSDEEKKAIEKACSARPGSTLLFVADTAAVTNEVLAKLRNRLGKELGLYDPAAYAFCWVTDFPLFSYNEDEKRWEPAHHMFSMPKKEFLDTLESDPGSVLADLYDVVLNGVELGSGSIRVHDPAIQERIMTIIGLSKEEAHEKFGFLLEAYQYGAPTHGGMGLGFDRLVALLCGTEDIREVIAFPKNKNAECPMDGSPNAIDSRQWDELGLAVKK